MRKSILLGAMLALVLLAIVPALAEDTPSGPDAPGKGKADPGKADPGTPGPDTPVGEPPPAESAGPIPVPEVPVTPVGEEAPGQALKTPPVPLEQAAPVGEAPAEAPAEDPKPPPAPVEEDTPPVVEAPSKAPEAPPVQPKPDIPEDPEDPPVPVKADTPAKDVSSKDSGGPRLSAIPEIPGSGSFGERLKALSDCELLELLGFGCGPDADNQGVGPANDARRGDRADDEDERTPGRRGSLKNEVGQEAESGDVKQSIDVSNSGDYASQCVAVLQEANSGNVQNASGATQSGSEADDIKPGGTDIAITPQLVQDCRQIIQQTVVAQFTINNPQSERLGSTAGGSKDAVRPPSAATSGLVGFGGGAVGAGGSNAINNAPRMVQQFGAGLSRPAPIGLLPRTGGPGIASLLTLGVGVLLIGGGLVTRRMGLAPSIKRGRGRALLMGLGNRLRTTINSFAAGVVSQARRAAGSADAERDGRPSPAPFWVQEEGWVTRAGSAAAAPRRRRRRRQTMKTRWYRALLMELLMELRKRLPRATRRKSSTGGTVSQGRAAGSADVEGDVWPPAVPSWAQEEDAVEPAGSAAAAPRTRRKETLERL